MISSYEDVLFRVEREEIGWITLNRPKVINALDRDMVRWIDAMLAAWGRRSDRCGRTYRGIQAQVKLALSGRHPLPRRRFQDLQLGIVVS
jgi:hypothetical protein